MVVEVEVPGASLFVRVPHTLRKPSRVSKLRGHTGTHRSQPGGEFTAAAAAAGEDTGGAASFSHNEPAVMNRSGAAGAL